MSRWGFLCSASISSVSYGTRTLVGMKEKKIAAEHQWPKTCNERS